MDACSMAAWHPVKQNPHASRRVTQAIASLGVSLRRPGPIRMKNSSSRPIFKKTGWGEGLQWTTSTF